MDSIRIVGAGLAVIVLGMGVPIGVLRMASKPVGDHESPAHVAQTQSDGSTNYLKVALESSIRAQGAVAAEAEAMMTQGATLYAACVACHKDTGQGDRLLNSPALAGQEDWYLLSQMSKFKHGLRGAHPEDITGAVMPPMMALLAGEPEMKAVAAYLAAKPFVKNPAVLEGGDAEKGKATYAVCMACHGPEGLGNVALKAPAIAGQSDWYMVNQLKKFKGGIRGYHADDVEGKQMQPMAMALADEQAMIDVATYIHDLR